ncbi:hypothetical protein PAAG_11837 [Paracoccidioides lutzii Pb01]|uniref:Uncharacterized protein n=1 Tax=Paracoccidioides lutzii (strain ATCC MYA-826 / Pb01) TaxID=502779 RepID=A0A0A2V545_PARBA|nr:hypothetical protein PAAG_11837 [Paracoccidioides lutzii Pb01]KGQ01487.1 hypothetical protein PAAG_11837 [Paracoccidioides lutzii Pb01]
MDKDIYERLPNTVGIFMGEVIRDCWDRDGYQRRDGGCSALSELSESDLSDISPTDAHRWGYPVIIHETELEIIMIMLTRHPNPAPCEVTRDPHTVVIIVNVLVKLMALKTRVTVMSHLQNAPGGFKHVGEDGILRSFDGNGNVVDYTRLS